MDVMWYLVWGAEHTGIQGTNISSAKALLKMSFLFPRWDMLDSFLEGWFSGENLHEQRFSEKDTILFRNIRAVTVGNTLWNCQFLWYGKSSCLKKLSYLYIYNTYVYVIFTVLLYFKDIKRNIFLPRSFCKVYFSFTCESPRFSIFKQGHRSYMIIQHVW